MKIDLYIFDMGEVVILDGMNTIEIASSLGIEKRAFELDYAKYDYPMMEGFMDTSLYMLHLKSEFGVDTKGNIFSSVYSPRTNTLIMPVVNKIKEEGKRVVIGSNTFRPHVEVIEKLPERPLSCFDKLYFSHEMNLSKPSLSFYRYIIEKEGVKAENTLFIDDREENIESASLLGINTFLYKSERNDDLISYIDKILEER